MSQIDAGINPVRFQSQGQTLAGHLYCPVDFDPKASYPTVVFSPPFNQVKEQTGAVYARHLAAEGYITLVFDHLGYGDSEGAIRNNENAFVKTKAFVEIDGASHVDLYDKDVYVGQAVTAMRGFFEKHAG